MIFPSPARVTQAHPCCCQAALCMEQPLKVATAGLCLRSTRMVQGSRHSTVSQPRLVLVLTPTLTGPCLLLALLWRMASFTEQPLKVAAAGMARSLESILTARVSELFMTSTEAAMVPSPWLAS